MAIFKAANTQFAIPDGGSIFIQKNPNGIAPIVYIRSGDNFFAFPISQLVPTFPKNDGYAYYKDSSGQDVRIDNAGQVWNEAERIFNEMTGLSFRNLPQQNIADVEAAARSTGGVKPLSDLNQFIQAKDTAQSGGDIDISQGQTFNAATGDLMDSSGKIIGNTRGATGSTTSIPPAPEGVNLSAQINNSVQLPSSNLEPGMSGAQVKSLQQWLINNGYSIPSGATGFYGKETTAAVAALQQKLGVDVGQYPGYFGPKTISAVSGGGAGSSGSSGSAGGSGIDSIDQQIDSIIQTMIESGKAINPGLTDEDLDAIDPANFLAEAEKSIDPYYRQKFAEVRDGLVRSLNEIGYDLNLQRQKTEESASEVLRTGGEELAGRGLAFSSTRDRFNTDTETAKQRDLLAADTKALRGAQEFGTAAESLIGTSALKGMSTPSIAGRQPFDFSSEPLTGTLVSERKYSAESIAKELAADEAARRAYTTRALSFS